MTNVGHDHINDYCADWKGIQLCYAGGCGFGSGAYGRAGWARRARVIELGQDAASGDTTIRTWKRLDYYLGALAKKDEEQIWPAPAAWDLRSGNYTPSTWRPDHDD